MQAQSYLNLLTLLWTVYFTLFAVTTPITTVHVYSISHEA